MKSIMRQTKIVMIAIAIVMGVSTTRKTWGKKMKVVVVVMVVGQGGVYQWMIQRDSYVIIVTQTSGFGPS